MGPPISIDGKGPHADVLAALEVASMGPPISIDGKLRAIVDIEEGSGLQWGRRLASTESDESGSRRPRRHRFNGAAD